ncbi:MAG TPA: YbaK/EbsC family protein, partial [Tepidisphaeraceae bacterium]|nr:YbaK/EbsC family protein [Tepidisphaeraceae bacterium]
MATRRIREFLDGSAARYTTINHTSTHTAHETAAASHIPAWKMAKTVIVSIDDRLAMAVIPANKDLDLPALRRQTGAREVRLAYEAEFADRFDGCQLGTVPPFGNLFGMETFIDQNLLQRNEIAFSAGTHTDSIVMRTGDYERLVWPKALKITVDLL